MTACRTVLSIGQRLVALFAVVMFVESGSTYGQNGAVGIAYPAKGITIDGDLSDWPKNLHTYPIERVEFGDKLVGNDDLNAHFRIAYNAGEHALYIAVEVRDDSVVLDGPGEVVWNNQDGCELFIDAAHAGSGSPIVQYARYGNQNRIVGPLEASEKTMKVAVTRTDSRICLRMACRGRLRARSRPGDRVRRRGGGQGQGRLVFMGRLGEWDSESEHAGPVRGSPSGPPRNAIRRGLRPRELERSLPIGSPLPGTNSIVPHGTAMARGASSIRRGLTRPRPSPWAHTQCDPWIPRMSASMRSPASRSRSRPIVRRKPSPSASRPSPGPD